MKETRKQKEWREYCEKKNICWKHGSVKAFCNECVDVAVMNALIKDDMRIKTCNCKECGNDAFCLIHCNAKQEPKKIYLCPNCGRELPYDIFVQILGNNCCSFPNDEQKKIAHIIEGLTFWPSNNEYLVKLRGKLNIAFYNYWLKNKQKV